MNRVFVFLILLSPALLLGQWRPLSTPDIGGRYDDVFFVDELNGWAVNNRAQVYKTTDGGETWEFNFTADYYLRSIEFATPNLGYIGSLYSKIYRTQDGGETWVDISENVDFDITYNDENYTSVPGACGLSAPSENTIYACGLWSGAPPFLTKSTDGGDTWTTFDMSSHATQLVDVLFLDDNEGFLTGRNDPIGNEKGGVILHTTDGGETWNTVLETGMSRDYIWKIQTPDSTNFFGSIQSEPYTNNVRFVKSTDGGLTWEIEVVQADKWNYMQMVGFKDANTGWTGGTGNSGDRETALFQTDDGGETWAKIETHGNSTFNRFFMLNNESIFLTGRQVYVYDENYPEEEPPLLADQSLHELLVTPNPTGGAVSIKVNISQFTRTRLEVLNTSGQLIKTIQSGTLTAGEHTFMLNLENEESGLYFLSLHTNEGLNYARLIKE